jgi:hypothetical protein
MGASPRKAPLTHFHGALTVGPAASPGDEVPKSLDLFDGPVSTNVRAQVGTFSAEHGCWVVVRVDTDRGKGRAFPADVAPVVDVEFAPKAASGAPVKKRYLLDQFC